eukprot:CAMPEP_0194284580 /NCGR_PEP_ID=MMETSP0169-20130528/27917_1 /TAXON_ID=218684 /ORGANISM="Corethron pennatum, Strain L29A3" /LENGTH=224 /DNA_ID=CAMNT_0039030421 /DNA_START=152 /DNA_END=823 /DNA_ORIENTATION=+
MNGHAGASPHWEKLWAADGGLPKGTRFDVAGVARPLAAELSRRRPPTSGKSALVPGCGRAYDALALAEHGYADVVALDISLAACHAAREEMKEVSSSAAERVEIRCADFFALDEERKFDTIWDCTFLCALDPSAREEWARRMASLLAPGGELLTAVFPIGDRDGGPPYAMSVSLVRSLLEPAGFEAIVVLDSLPIEEQHRRPGDDPNSVLTRGTALVTWMLRTD